MALIPIRIGVPEILLEYNDSTSLPSLVTVTPQVCAVTEINVGEFVIADVKAPLQASVNYQFALSLVGRQSDGKGGYSVGHASQGSGVVSVTAGQGVRVYVPNASLPTNYDKAIVMAIWGRKGNSSTWYLYDFAYIDPGVDFNHLILAEPLVAAPSTTLAILQSTSTAYAPLGDRTPLGVGWASVGVTTGAVTVTRDVTTVSVSPNNAPDFNVVTSRAANLKFSTLANGVVEVIKASSGNYGKVAIEGGSFLEVAQQTLLTAQAILKGNKSIKLTMPASGGVTGETRLYLGNLTISQAQITEAWNKAATTPIEYVLQTAPQDSLLNSCHTELVYRRT